MAADVRPKVLRGQSEFSAIDAKAAGPLLEGNAKAATGNRWIGEGSLHAHS